MLNHKGQVLVIFVLCLPVFLLIGMYIFDISNVGYEKSKLEGISYLVQDSVEEENEAACDIVIKNDDKIKCFETIDKVIISKKVKSLFGVFYNKEYFEIEKIIEK